MWSHSAWGTLRLDDSDVGRETREELQFISLLLKPSEEPWSGSVGWGYRFERIVS